MLDRNRLGDLAEVMPDSDTELPAERPALSLSDVSVNFGGIHAIAGVTTDVAVNEVTAIIGPNGAGKTTMLNAVSGLIRGNTTGYVEVLGKSVLGWSPNAIARCGLGRSFQDPPLLEKETVLENVLVGAHLSLDYGGLSQLFRPGKVRRAEQAAKERAMAVMEFTGLTRFTKTRVDGLPYGTRKLIDIARALVSGPPLLFLDEPTSGLDAEEQRIVRDILLELRRQERMTVVLIEHHMDLVRAVATSVIGLQAGTVLATGTPSEVLDSEAFRAAVVGATDDETANIGHEPVGGRS